MNDAEAVAIARRAARIGGQVARDLLEDQGYVSWKGRRDVVTGAILEVQSAILTLLDAEAHGQPVLAEEGPEDEPIPVEAESLWIVDPICGSLNYAQGIPFYCISIAWRSRGEIRAAVVYDPSRDEMFEATADGDALLNGEPIAVQQISEGYDAFEKAWVGTDLPHDGDKRDEGRQIMGVVDRQVISLTTMGSPALSICYIACGRLHAYWHLDLKVWDIAAAYLILRRAGGTFTNAEGDSWLHSDGGYIASNSIIHGWTLRSLQQVFELKKMKPFGVEEPRPATPFRTGE